MAEATVLVEAAGHPVSPDADLPGAGVWWDVAPAEVSDSSRVAHPRAGYEEGRTGQRWYG